MAKLLIVYVGQASQNNLKHGLTKGIWGFKKKVANDLLTHKDDFKEDIYLLIGTGYTGGSPRVDYIFLKFLLIYVSDIFRHLA